MANKYAFEVVGAEETNVKYLTETLQEIKDRLFDTLMQAQRASIGMYRFDKKFTSEIIDKKWEDKIYFTIPMTFIDKDDRFEYRNNDRKKDSDIYTEDSNINKDYPEIGNERTPPVVKRGGGNENFYKKEVTDEIILKNPDVFKSRLLMFIDGKIYNNFTIIPFENKTMICFKVYYNYTIPMMERTSKIRDGFLKTEIDEFITKESDVTFLVFPNFKSAVYSIDKSNNNISSVNNNLHINSFKYDDTKEVLSEADLIDGQYLCLVSSNSDNFCSNTIIKTQVSDGELLIDDTSKLPNFNSNDTQYYKFKLLILPNFNEKKEIEPVNKFFSLKLNDESVENEYLTFDLKDSPIPTESIILFTEDSSGNILFDHHSTLDLYYPNIYEIKRSNHQHKMIMLSFYVNDFGTEARKYINEVRLYHKFATDIVKGIASDISELYDNTEGYETEVINFNKYSLTYHSTKNFSNISKVLINDEVLSSNEYEYDSIEHSITFKNTPGLVTEYVTANGINTTYILNNAFKNDIMSVTITTPERVYEPAFTYDSNSRRLTITGGKPEVNSIISITDRIKTSFEIEFANAEVETTRYDGKTVRKMTIPEYIKNYKPSGIPYSINDYLFNGLGETDSNNNPIIGRTSLEHLRYKISRLISLIDKNGDHYSVYLNKINRAMIREDIDYDPTDIITVSRDNPTYNGIEFTLYGTLSIISEDKNNEYVHITIRKTDDMPIIYINNRYFFPKYQYSDNEYRHIYIPRSLIIDDTLIKAEFLTNFEFSKRFTPTSTNEYFRFDVDENFRISALDLFVTYLDNGNEKYLPISEYDFYKSLDDGVYEKISDDKFYPYTTYYIKMTNSTFLNQELNIRTASDSFLINNIDGDTRFVINEPFDDGREGQEIIVSDPLIIKNDLSRFLFFKNGQLVPTQAIRAHFSDNIAGEHTFDIILKNRYNDIFTLVYPNVTYTPVQLTNHPNVMSIPENGIVDLTGYIDKPLDFRWYDIYLNGNRMNENTAEFLGPYLLRIKNVTTRKHLEIYEKNFHNLNSVGAFETNDSTTYIYKNLLQDLTFDFYIPDTDPDILDELIIDYIGFLDEMRMRIKMINPDVLQLSTEMVNKYHGISVSETDLNIFINPDTHLDMGKSIFFNPSDTYEYEGIQERV